jgi:hypothetical protein
MTSMASASSPGLDWITALRAPAIKALLDGGALQMSLFDDRDMAGITSPEFPGERLIVCRNRALAAERARKRKDLLGAISGALTLLANIVMAWNTHRLQIAIDRVPGEYPDEVLSRIAPIGYKHINLRGIMTFDLSQLGPSLLGRPPDAVQKRASS